MAWLVRVKLENNDDGNKSLGIYLHSFSPVKSCNVTYKVKIHNSIAEKAFTQAALATFSIRSEGWGLLNKILWEKLVHPAEGFVKDNSTTVEVTFTVDPPNQLYNKVTVGFI